MNFKKALLAIIAVISFNVACAQSPERMFPYPEPPEELVSLGERTSYLVEHFWERCRLPESINFRAEFETAFTDYVSFMPYADADVVHKSIANLIEKFNKDPEKLLTLAEIAEKTLYLPDGEFLSDEVYLPFAKAVADHKKIKKDRKAHYVEQVNVLSCTQVGMPVPEIEFTRADGTKGKLSELTGAYTLILFMTPDCDDCYMTRLRLSADANVNALIEKGSINVVCIATCNPDDEWRKSVENYNKRWTVGAAPDVAKRFDMRNPPVFYYLSPDHKIMSKTLVIDGLLEAFRRANQQQ